MLDFYFVIILLFLFVFVWGEGNGDRQFFMTVCIYCASEKLKKMIKKMNIFLEPTKHTKPTYSRYALLKKSNKDHQ